VSARAARGSAWWYLGLGVEPPPVSVYVYLHAREHPSASAHILECRSVTPFAPTRRRLREEKRGIARLTRGIGGRVRGTDDACRQSPRPERSHHRATTERERGNPRESQYLQPRSHLRSAYFSASLFRLPSAFTYPTSPEIQIAESVLAAKVIEDNFDLCFIHDDVLRRFYVIWSWWIKCWFSILLHCVFVIINRIIHKANKYFKSTWLNVFRICL